MTTITRTRQIAPEVLNVLATAQCSGKELRLPDQLDRKLYTRTNEVLEALGGKWNRKAKAHIFECDAAELVEQAVLTGMFTNTKQDFGAFFTPIALAKIAVKHAQIKPGMKVLEPSAGDGILARVAREEGADVTCYELQENLCEKLSGIGFNVDCGDFLTMKAVQEFDRVVMNPPFAKRADIRHIMHAFSFLKPGGRLVAIASAAVKFRDDNIGKSFRLFVETNGGDIEDLPDGSFRESGTMVNTVMLHMTRRE